MILLCFIRSGSSSGKGGGRLPPSLSLPPASDDVLCDCWLCRLWPICFLSFLSSPFCEGTDTSWVFFTLKNTGEGGRFSMGLESPSMAEHLGFGENHCEDGAQIHYYVAQCGWVALNPSHLFLVLNFTGVFCSRACSSLGSILSRSEWLHCLCFCRRTFEENAASQ